MNHASVFLTATLFNRSNWIVGVSLSDRSKAALQKACQLLQSQHLPSAVGLSPQAPALCTLLTTLLTRLASASSFALARFSAPADSPPAAVAALAAAAASFLAASLAALAAATRSLAA